MEFKRFVVTGGCGFIGSHLVRKLINSGADEIIIIDNLKYGNIENLSEILNSPKVKVYKEHIQSISKAYLEECFKNAECLYHLAAEKHNQSIDDPEKVMQANIEGTHRLFNAANSAGVKKVIFTSSLYANGRYNLPAMSENDLPEPKTIYGISKVAGEHLCKHFKSNYDLDYTIFRLFFVYGTKQYAGMGYKSVIIKNFERILNNQPPIILGSGEQALDYIYVDDVVNALILAQKEKYNQKMFNIGSGEAISINKLTNKMLAIAKSSLIPQYEEADWTDKTYRVADMTNTNENFEWKKGKSLSEGLAEVYEWMKNN